PQAEEPPPSRPYDAPSTARTAFEQASDADAKAEWRRRNSVSTSCLSAESGRDFRLISTLRRAPSPPARASQPPVPASVIALVLPHLATRVASSSTARHAPAVASGTRAASRPAEARARSFSAVSWAVPAGRRPGVITASDA